MNIRVLGAHNCESQDSKLVSLLVDDTLALDAGGLTSSLSLPAQRKLRAVLLTHQHYDHIRDIPALAMNLFLQGASIDIYASLAVCQTVAAHLFDGKLYPDFLEQPPENPAVKFTVIEPYRTEQLAGYSIMAVEVNHPVPTLGYQVTSSDGKAAFYTGDTGPGLTGCWQYVSPQLLITEVTAPDSYQAFGRESGHLTPGLLKQELVSFQAVKGYLPRVVAVHMNPYLEKEIEAEIAVVAGELNADITLAYEGMQIYL